jgi:hypothetical protein
VQQRREGVTKIVQRFQARIQGGMVHAFKAGKAFRLPLPLRLVLRVPGLRNLPPRIPAFGVRRTKLERPEVVVGRF